MQAGQGQTWLLGRVLGAQVAMRNKMDLSIGIAIGSSLQVRR